MISTPEPETFPPELGLAAFVSIHDVMPSCMQGIEELIGLCRSHGVESPTLLVVPGLDWTHAQLDLLRRWNNEGCCLAGHGWLHRCEHITSWKHRLHSTLISRNVAEHLSLSSRQEIDLMRRCACWFDEHGFQPPKLYVPPAWAMGKVTLAELKEQPFPMVETLAGVILTQTQKRIRMPLLGFEADTRLRRQFLTTFNWLNLCAHSKTARSIRISIHPHDHRSLLADSLKQTLSRGWNCKRYDELLSSQS